MSIRLTALATTVGLLATVCVSVVSLAGPAAAASTTVSNDNLRTGWDRDEPALSPTAVGSSDFGQLWDTALPAPAVAAANQVYAQPITVGSNVITASEENQVTASDEATGSQKWSVNLGPSWPAATIGCGDLTPDIGTTSTPVYDSSTNTIFLTTKVNNGPDVQHPNWQLHALDASTGAERSGWPVTISGSPTNDSGHPFSAENEQQRPGLLLLNGSIYIGFGSHCDHHPYVGYVAGVNTSTRALALWSSETQLSSSGAGIWQGGGGLSSDGSGGIFLTTGNGISPAPGPGNQPPGTLGESLVHLSVNNDGSLKATDFFSPANNAKLDTDDTDFGSGGPLGIPDGFGSTAIPHLIVAVGKDGRLFLMNRDSLGGNAQGANGGDSVLNTTWLRGVWGHPAFWGGDGGYVYVVENSGYLQAVRIGKNSSGVPALSSAGNSLDTFGYTSGSPIVTSNGTTSGSALVWVVQVDNATGSNARLLAYDAVPNNRVMTLEYSAPIGTAAKFVMPTADNGRIFVATRTGHLLAFGRPATSAVTAQPTDFGTVAVGTTTNATATITANSAVTIQSVTTNAPFGVGSGLSLPSTLTAGQSLSVPVAFTPTSGGSVTQSLSVTLSTGAVYKFDLVGFGTQTSLTASPSTVNFGQQVVGSGTQIGVSLQNNGTSALTINTVTAPTAPFTGPSLPTAGTTVQPGQAITVTVGYQPTVTGTASSSLVLDTNQGTTTVPLTGSAVSGSSHLTITAPAVDFGHVATGASSTKTITVSNTGTVPLTITKAAPPTGVFSVATPLPEGQTLQPGDAVTLSITFTPATTAPVYGTYLITSDDGNGQQTVTFTGNGGTGPVSWASGCLDLPGASPANGAAIVSNPCTGAATQQVTQQGDQGTEILQLNGKCVAVKNNANTNYAAIVAATCNPTSPGQQWSWRSDDGLYNANANLCMNAPSTTAGVALQLYTCNRTTNQHWWLQPVTPQGPVTTPAGLCMAPVGGATVNGTKLALAGCDGSAAQTMQVPGNGTLQVHGQCLDVTGSKFAAGTPIQLWGCNASNAQQWTTGANNSIRNPASGLCLGAAGAATTSGTSLQLTTCTGGASQQWTEPLLDSASQPTLQPLTGSPASLAYGSVTVGSSANLSVAFTNPNTTAATVMSVKLPSAPFSAANQLAANTSIPAGGTVTVPVTFAPTSAAAAQDTYAVTTAQGTVTVNLSGTGTSPTPPPPTGVTGPVSWASGCLDLPGSSPANGAAVVSNPCTGATTQRLTSQLGQGTPTLQLNGKCVAVRNNATTNYAAIVAASCDVTSPGQQWAWRSDDSLFNANANLCLNAPSTAGAALQLYTCNRSINQHWWLQAVTPQGPVSSPAGVCLGTVGGATINATKLALAACDDSAAQMVQVPSNGTLQIHGQCLDVTSSKFAAGTPIQLWGCNASTGQQWATGANNSIRNVTSGLCLGTAGAATNAGTTVQLTTCTGGASQQWTLPS